MDGAYKKYQFRNFIGIYIGYSCYYLLRNNISFAMPELIKLGYSKSQLGWALSAVPIAYGISKFIMGNLSDRSNPRYFITAGLAVAAIVCLVLGVLPSVTIGAMYMLMLVNGWAQGMGAGPCYRTVAHWFPITKRGTVMGVWNTSHNVGGALLATISAMVIYRYGWRSIFCVPAMIVFILVPIIIMLMKDSPQSVGLMPIEEYSNEYPENKSSSVERELSGKEILFKYVLVNKYVWFLSIANAFVYFVRYGIESWAPTYLVEVRGVHMAKAGWSIAIYQLSGIVGMLLCGYASDKWFKGRRAPVSIICMITVLLGVLLYWFSFSLFTAYVALFIIGMFIYGPVMLVGVQVLDIMPKKAVGTAIGLLGLFGYWLGTTASSIGFGYIVDFFGWRGGFMALVASCASAIFFFSLTLGIKSTQKT